MPILVWISRDPATPDVYPEAETVQEYGAGHLRVWSADSQKVIAHYAPGEWIKTLRADWPGRSCACTRTVRRYPDGPGGTMALPIEMPRHRLPWHDQRSSAHNADD